MVRVKQMKSNVRTSLLARRRRGGRRRRGSRRRGGRAMHYVETVPISIELGGSVDLKYSLLKNRPHSMNFRVQYIHFVGQTAYTTEGSNSGDFAPAAVQLSIYNTVSSGEIVATSGPVVLGNNPRNIKIYQPRQSDWVPFTQNENESFGKIEAACLGSAGKASKTYVRGVIHILVRFGSEVVTAKCIALQNWIDSNLIQFDLDDNSVELNSYCDVADEIEHLQKKIDNLKSLNFNRG